MRQHLRRSHRVSQTNNSGGTSHNSGNVAAEPQQESSVDDDVISPTRREDVQDEDFVHPDSEALPTHVTMVNVVLDDIEDQDTDDDDDSSLSDDEIDIILAATAENVPVMPMIEMTDEEIELIPTATVDSEHFGEYIFSLLNVF